jgi:hypothetical protein
MARHLAKVLALIQASCDTARRDPVIMETQLNGDIGTCTMPPVAAASDVPPTRGCVTADILMQLAVAGLENINGFQSLKYVFFSSNSLHECD